MKLSYKVLAFCGAVSLFFSCEDVFDKRDLTGLNEQVWNDTILARVYVDYAYDQNLPTWPGNSNLSDESYGESVFFEGTVQVNTVSDFGTSINVNNNYGKIRSINQFFQEIDKGSLAEGPKNRLKGQMYFLRAWRYFDLVRLYGGVPLVLEPQNAVGEAKDHTFVTRNKTSEVFAQIAKDLDQAAATLPGKWTSASDWGRITSGAAAALKGRAWLYWASPQYNPADLTDRWQKAYEANKMARDLLVANGFRLHNSFEDMWFAEVNNPEAVFVTGYNNSTNDQQRKNNTWDNGTRPGYLGTGGGANQPTKEMIDAFPMKDGKKINDATSKYAYNPQLFYKNRDPRFDKTIAYNGTTWSINGNSSYRLWTYLVGNKSVEPKATNTGFYTRKAIDKNAAAGNVQYVGTDWMEIRFAEVLLNLAESACGVNKLDEAYAELKEIRKRAGIEAGADGLYGLPASMTRDEMFKAILQERQLEFAFEGKRYWDLRRHKLFETVLNGKRRNGLTITLKTSGVPADFAATRDNVNLDEAYTKYFTIATKSLDTKYAINWKPEYYFFALPQQALDNNPKLEQTMGWNGGTFDPLQ